MAFGIIRVRNLKAADLRATDIHNSRRYEEVGLSTPDNLLPGERGLHGINSYEGGQADDAVEVRLKDMDIKPRKNSVVALEFVVSASPEFFEKYSPDAFFDHAVDFLGKRYGRGNVVAVSRHFDESTPHAHVIVTPIQEKEVRWKNQRGEGVRKEARLCARDITGGPDKLRQLQEDYHKFVKPFGDRYGIEFFRGTKAEQQLNHYTRQTNAKIGAIRNDLRETDVNIAQTRKLLQEAKIGLKEAMMKIGLNEQKIADLERQQKELQAKDLKAIEQAQKLKEIRQDKNRGNGWKKGKDFGIGF